MKQADSILAKIRDVLEDWEKYADRYDVSETVRRVVRAEIERRRDILAGTRAEMPDEPPELLVGSPDSR